MIRTWWRRIGPWLTPAMVVAEIVLVWSGWISLRNAVIVAVVVEFLLAIAVVGRGTSAFHRFRASRTEGRAGWLAAEDGLAQLMPRRAGRVLLLEARIWTSFFQLILVRRQRSPGAFTYSRNLRLALIVVLVLLVLEGAIVETVLAVILGDSAWVWVTLGLHLYALVWIAGFLGSMHQRPHLVGPHGLRLRDSVFAEVVVPYDAVKGACAAVQSNFGRSGLKIDRDEGTALLAYGDATVRIDLHPGAGVEVNGEARRGEFTRLAITADDPAGFVQAVNNRRAKFVPTD